MSDASIQNRTVGLRSISQGVPPRTSADATPGLDKKGELKFEKRGIIKVAVKAKIPPSSDSRNRRPVGEITKPPYTEHAADYIRRRESINNNFN